MPDGAYREEARRDRRRSQRDFARHHGSVGRPDGGPSARDRLERLGLSTTALRLPAGTDLDQLCVIHLALAEHHARRGRQAEAVREADLGLRALRRVAAPWAGAVEARLWAVYQATA